MNLCDFRRSAFLILPTFLHNCHRHVIQTVLIALDVNNKYLRCFCFYCLKTRIIVSLCSVTSKRTGAPATTIANEIRTNERPHRTHTFRKKSFMCSDKHTIDLIERTIVTFSHAKKFRKKKQEAIIKVVIQNTKSIH